jgi:hypothetical protein
MRTLAPVLALALCCGTLVAGVQGDQDVDVHVLELVTPDGELVPTAKIVAARRISSSSPAERAVSVRVGGTRIEAEISTDADGLQLMRSMSRSGSSHHSTSSLSASERTLDLTEQFRWGRRPRHGEHVRGALLCEPVSDPSRPFVALDVSGFMRRIVDALFDTRSGNLVAKLRGIRQLRRAPQIQHLEYEWYGSLSWKAGLVLGSVPLDLYITAGQVDRILEMSSELEQHVDQDSWPFLRPLIVLGDRHTLETLARRRRARVGDYAVTAPRVPRMIEDSILVAYAEEADPEMRGLTGWIATGTRSPALYEMLVADVKAGRAILPGNESERAALADHIVSARAWQSVSQPILTLVASALVIGGVLLLVRIIVRRLL